MTKGLLIAILIAFAGWAVIVWLISLLAKRDAFLKGAFAFVERFRPLIFILAIALVLLFLVIRFASLVNPRPPQPATPPASPTVSPTTVTPTPTPTATPAQPDNIQPVINSNTTLPPQPVTGRRSPQEETHMLFGSTLLEVAIGMIFVYLLLSLLCSALSELIESFIKFRARDLEKGIGKLLNDPDLAQEFFNHPLVKPLGDNPSYIPARTFSLALWNIATTRTAQGEAAAAGVSQNLAEIRAMIAGIQDAKLQNIKKALVTLIDEAGTDIDKARANVEQWYNDAMDRVSGWYKRRTHWILIVLGLLAAFAFNVDSITVVKALWYNDGLRASVVAAAEDYAKANPAPNPAPQGTTTPPQTSATPLTPEQEAAQARQKISTITSQFNDLHLPVGWPGKPPEETDAKYTDITDKQVSNNLFEADKQAYETDPRHWPPLSGQGWIWKLLGIIITALAVSQGAPFWFDMLNKFIVIRSTVKPREKSQPEASKDKSSPPPTPPSGATVEGKG